MEGTPRLLASITGNLNTIVAGTQTGVGQVVMHYVQKDTLAALIVVDAETNGITLQADWQVSNDGSNWYACSTAPNNPATVVLATGTAGADAAVTRVVPAPLAVYSGFTYARVAITNLVQTGAAADTYSVRYAYRENA